jgi:hypothetical protein
MKAMHDKRMGASKDARRKKRTACQETTEARLKCEEPTSADTMACQEMTAFQEATETEPDPGMMQSIEVHQEIPKGEASV